MIRLFLVMTALLAQLLAAVGVDDIFQRMMNVPVSALIDVRADGTEKINMGMWAKHMLGYVAHIILAAIIVRIFIVRSAIEDRIFDNVEGMWLGVAGLFLLLAPLLIVLVLIIQPGVAANGAGPLFALSVLVSAMIYFTYKLDYKALAGHIVVLCVALLAFTYTGQIQFSLSPFGGHEMQSTMLLFALFGFKYGYLVTLVPLLGNLLMLVGLLIFFRELAADDRADFA